MSQNTSLNEGRIQPDDDMNEYHCAWEIDVSAQTPEEAARFAQSCTQDSRAWLVSTPGGETITIDLDDEDPLDAPIPPSVLETLYDIKQHFADSDAVQLACPNCGSDNLSTIERVSAIAECDGIFADGPAWSGYTDYTRGSANSVGVWCEACEWNYEGADWLTKLVPYTG